MKTTRYRAISTSIIALLCFSLIIATCYSTPVNDAEKQDLDSTVIKPDIVLEYMIMVTVREENSSIAIPIPANMTIHYQNFLDNSTINSTMTVSSFILTLYYEGSEIGEIWENVTTRELQNIILDQTNLLYVFYQVYNNESSSNFTPFWIFIRDWAIGEKINAFSYELDITNVSTFNFEYIGERSVVIASVTRNLDRLQDEAKMVYDQDSGLLVQGEIISWNGLYFDPPVIYTTRLELVRSNFDFTSTIETETTGTTEITDPIITPIFITFSRGTTIYMVLATSVPIMITLINFSRIKKIKGGVE